MCTSSPLHKSRSTLAGERGFGHLRPSPFEQLRNPFTGTGEPVTRQRSYPLSRMLNLAGEDGGEEGLDEDGVAGLVGGDEFMQLVAVDGGSLLGRRLCGDREGFFWGGNGIFVLLGWERVG